MGWDGKGAVGLAGAVLCCNGRGHDGGAVVVAAFGFLVVTLKLTLQEKLTEIRSFFWLGLIVRLSRLKFEF